MTTKTHGPGFSQLRHYSRSAGILLALATAMLANSAHAQSEKRTYSDEELATMPAPGPNPFLSFLPADATLKWRPSRPNSPWM